MKYLKAHEEQEKGQMKAQDLLILSLLIITHIQNKHTCFCSELYMDSCVCVCVCMGSVWVCVCARVFIFYHWLLYSVEVDLDL